ncbi:unnamed protein product [Paramecium pentaurelia]|uniref:WD40-repeat-containing domain n=1 Tax=Paramecium pentaurelia TaxID=43138 RepID=A0A8S1TAP3_9CILI|nr:unnamed protein product [Paramecium pentaurelia]
MICQICQNNRTTSIIFSNNCEIHRQQFQSVALSLSNKTKTFKACKKCEEERVQDKFFNFNDIKQKLNQSEYAERINEIVQLSKKIIQQTKEGKDKLIRLTEEIVDTVMNGIYQMFQLQSPNQAGQGITFSAQEIFNLLTPSTIKTLEDLKNRQISIHNAEDISSMLITKILYMDQFRDFLYQIEKNSEGITIQMKQRIENLEQTKDKIKQQFMQIQPYVKENFDNESIIKQIKGEKQQQLSFEQSDIHMVKAIMNIDSDQLVYAKRDCISILDKKNNFIEKQKILFENQDIISYACSFQDMEEKYIAAGIEQQDDKCKIKIWNFKDKKWNDFKEIETEQPILKIINPFENHIITCSENKKIEIINFRKNEQLNNNYYQEQQESINDIALINPSTLIFITNSDIKALNLKNKKILDQIKGNENHLCIEMMNSQLFVVGNSIGQVLICTFKDKILINQDVQLHEKDIRYICKIDQMHFITSSYDGKHTFAKINGNILKTIEEGPKANFPDPLLWDRDLNCLIASSGGQVYYYK